MAKIFIEESTLSAIGDSIRAKTGKTDMIPPLNMPTEIASIQTGGSSTPVSVNDVTFYDYDGTVVASYSLEEAQALTALPDGPTHAGLTFQGWNWSLADVNALTRPMNIGAMYITDDGKTRLYIRIADKARSTVPLYFFQTVANGVTIDWGDGSATETLAGTGDVNTSHAYGAVGDFMISLAVADGCRLGLGPENGSGNYCAMGSANNDGKVYCNILRSVNIGENFTRIYNYSFKSCGCLENITIPDSVTSIGKQSFNSCISLACIAIPDSVTSIRNTAFNSCFNLKSITIPDSVTSIYDMSFMSCYSLASITIPYSVSSIGSYAFSSCYGVAEYHLKPTTPPTLSSTNAFQSIPSDCIIYVPKGCLDAYKNATNWTTYASYMQEEP